MQKKKRNQEGGKHFFTELYYIIGAKSDDLSSPD